jgi:hypothetical protein
MVLTLRLVAVAAGAVLLLLAVLAPRRLGVAAASRWGSSMHFVAAIAGAALLGWGLISTLGSRSSSRAAPAPLAAPTAAPVNLVEVASAALRACPRAQAPAVPDGTKVSREEMAAATAAFKSFDTATNSYVHCVDVTIERIANQYAGVASQDDLRALKEFGTVAHNTAIDQEHAVADQLNAQIRTYKAQHPQS